MKKYYSQYSEEELTSTLDLLNNSWIQVALTGGTPNATVTMAAGDVKVLTNKIPSNVSFTARNCVVSTVANNTFIYPNYNSWLVNSTVSGSAKANARATYAFTHVQNHIYYLKAFVDGLNSNSANHGIQLELQNTPATSYASSFTTSLESNFMSCRGKITVANSSTVEVALYANKNSSAVASRVYFGRVQLTDLTATFGAGNEPTIGWCDSRLDYYINDNYTSTIVLNDPVEELESVAGTFDNSGNCLLSLPGFGVWTGVVVNGSTTTALSPITIDTVKRYSMSVS